MEVTKTPSTSILTTTTTVRFPNAFPGKTNLLFELKNIGIIDSLSQNRAFDLNTFQSQVSDNYLF